jgi:hypothetical protein
MGLIITGIVTRVDPPTGNFYMLPNNPRALGGTDLDGHRCGLNELSANLLNARAGKFKRFPFPLPAVGDVVQLEMLDTPLPFATGPVKEEFGDGP